MTHIDSRQWHGFPFTPRCVGGISPRFGLLILMLPTALPSSQWPGLPQTPPNERDSGSCSGTQAGQPRLPLTFIGTQILLQLNQTNNHILSECLPSQLLRLCLFFFVCHLWTNEYFSFFAFLYCFRHSQWVYCRAVFLKMSLKICTLSSYLRFICELSQWKNLMYVKTASRSVSQLGRHIYGDLQ